MDIVLNPARRAFAHERRPGAGDPPRRRPPRLWASKSPRRSSTAFKEKIKEYLREAKTKENFSWVTETGKSALYDGRTGEAFDQEVVVGYIYMMKLGHLVADKIHARAVGPYSLVTQQPLGGKAQYGGQRFGEMEVWAHGSLRRRLHACRNCSPSSPTTSRAARASTSRIVKGDNTLEAGTPESFNVLIKEMQALGLDVRVGGKEPVLIRSGSVAV